MRRGAVLWLGALLAAAPLRPGAAQTPPARGAEPPGVQHQPRAPQQTPAAPKQNPPARAQHPPVTFSADEVQYDSELGLVVAKGHVELDQGPQILLADTVTYNERTDTATASGHVSLLQPSGEIVFADYVELHDDMRDGFLKNVRMLLADRSRLAGNTARRVAGNRTEIRRGVYSPCEPCQEDPTRAPVWQIEAEEITHDKQEQLVEYRDATMEIDGVPLLWTPYFSHPDPSVKRASGFLFPSMGNSTANGYHLGIPYYWVISPDKDATFDPVYYSAGGTMLGGEYRQRFSDGSWTTDGSITLGSKAYTNIDTTPVSSTRWDINTTAQFDPTPDWRYGLDAYRASDPTYLLRYSLPSPYDFLTTHAYAENFGARSYGNISAWSFQSLETGVGDSIQPIVAPVADYQWVSEPGNWGSRLALDGNLMNLERITGIDTQRSSLGGDWRVPFADDIGGRYSFVTSLRGDGYQSENLPLANGGTESATAGRVFPQMALTWQYPWVRREEGYSQMIEPIAMVAASPYGGNPGTIPDEDSQGFEFDETSLFRPNRFPGYDLVDSGQRVDYGLRTGVYGDGGGSTRLTVGQSYAAQVNDNFLPGSGLEHHFSDVVGKATVAPNTLLSFTYDFRLGYDDLAMHSQQIGTTFGPPSLNFNANYLQIAPISDAPTLQKRKQLAAVINTVLTRYWSLQLVGVRDFSPTPNSIVGQTLGTAETLVSGVTLTYRDDCLAFVTQLTQSGIRSGDAIPGTALLFTVVFKNLGDFGTKVLSVGGT
ncbi:MAG TPA: LPS assembly protein LptD [Stellaceae bacterium]|nr:LPS assembly protein LptD [Stellaceae bacterium]